MTASTKSETDLMRSAVAAAVLAPSVHNTQPWRFVRSGPQLELHADRSRQLAVLDPTGRQLIISCGCALLNLRVELASRGYDPVIERRPDPDQPDLLARITLPAERTDWVPLAALHAQLPRRRANRRRFDPELVTPEAIYTLTAAAAAENAQLTHIVREEDRLTLARLTQRADELENADPAYRAELRLWTSDDPLRRDGVPIMAVPHVTGDARDDIPIRDFDTHGLGWLPAETHSGVEQCWLVLGTANDNPLAWLQAGEALERLWLEATRLDYVAGLFTQVIEIPYTRERLRVELSMASHPHVLLRVGRAPTTTPLQRRELSDVLADDTKS